MKITKLPTKLFAILSILFFVLNGAVLAQDSTGFRDDFSSESLNLKSEADTTGWKIIKGKFSTDGSDSAGNLKPVEGQLNFGLEEGTSVALELSKNEAKRFRGVRFLLRQSNQSAGTNHIFSVKIEDSEIEGGYYIAKMSLNPEHFQTSGFGGYAYRSLENAGMAGEALGRDGTWSDSIEVRFDPSLGMSLSVNGLDVLEVPNLYDLDHIDKITFTSETGQISWFLDELEIQLSE